jgi:hypothetical protein
MRSSKRQVLLKNDKLSFDLPLTTSLVPRLAKGSNVPTFTRATTATVTDFEGLLKTVKSGESRFEGARRVENLFAFSEKFDDASWVVTTSGGGTATISTDKKSITFDVPIGGRAFINRTQSGQSSNSHILSFNQVINSGTPSLGTITLGGTEAPSISTNGRISKITDASGTLVRFGLGCAGATTSACNATFTKPQLELVLGQSNINPSEYVSNGVLSAPYHGAGVDGVKYFPYENGNTVVDNVVTEVQGAPIPDATLKGYLAEGARTNLLLQSAVPATQNVTVTAVAHTISMWGTGTCTLSGAGSGVLTGTGVNDRVQLTFTPTAGILTLTFDGTNTKGQLEAGAFASSYIPTTTAAVTRNADVLTYPSAGNISMANGSAYCESSTYATAGLKALIDTMNNTFSGGLSFLLSTTIGAQLKINGDNNAAEVDINIGSGTINTVVKSAGRWATNSAQVYFTGTKGIEDNVATMPSTMRNVITIGERQVISAPLYGTIRNVKIWKKALKDTKLISMTS